jgi:hypothetical protein
MLDGGHLMIDWKCCAGMGGFFHLFQTRTESTFLKSTENSKGVEENVRLDG